MGLEDFKKYIKAHPLLKDEVMLKRMTWQEIYENYTLSDTDPYIDYIKKDEEKPLDNKDSNNNDKELSKDDIMKQVLGYVKKIDPDNVTKYVTSIQKILELLSSFGAGALTSSISKKNTTDPLFDRKFDDWY